MVRSMKKFSLLNDNKSTNNSSDENTTPIIENDYLVSSGAHRDRCLKAHLAWAFSPQSSESGFLRRYHPNEQMRSLGTPICPG